MVWQTCCGMRSRFCSYFSLLAGDRESLFLFMLFLLKFFCTFWRSLVDEVMVYYLISFVGLDSFVFISFFFISWFALLDV
ncbi:hypothetical protein FPQ18DRAFT_329514 [Pyronema domesticum]|nr:hypothetical protein FPQ18DRAFT_329514 [Pyronema domesticum]